MTNIASEAHLASADEVFRRSGGNGRLRIIAGPCVVESLPILREVASTLTPLCHDLSLPLVFKSSYRKANRTSGASFEGIGDERALDYLAEIRAEFGAPTLTDIHSAHEAERAARFVDALQIPAFLCRQTDIVRAAAATGKPVNIKKGQFLAPEAMRHIVEKISPTNDGAPYPLAVTERGTSFGYGDIVVDMRSPVVLRRELASFDAAVFYDATHSVQSPAGALGSETGGKAEFIAPLTRAALAAGVDGVFFETHPNPARARSDAATQIPLARVESFLRHIVEVYENLRSCTHANPL
jgi:2-dehydro-3-deoxyphosphooctonate aldolase (KDO 8-P synthase)